MDLLKNIKLPDNPLFKQLKDETEKLFREKYWYDLYEKFRQMYAPDVEYEGLTNGEIEAWVTKFTKEPKSMIKIETHEEFDKYKENSEIYEQFLEDENEKYVFRNDNEIFLIGKEIQEVDQAEYDINFALPKRYDLPEDMKYFYKLYGKTGLSMSKLIGYELKDDWMKKIWDEYGKTQNIIYGIEQIRVFDECILDMRDGSDFLIYKDKKLNINLNEWCMIYFDDNSCDNGCGRLNINLNPDSLDYGKIISYTSTDDSTINYVAKSFAEMIQMLVDVPMIPYVNDEQRCCNSITDHLNQYSYDCYEECWNKWHNPHHKEPLFINE